MSNVHTALATASFVLLWILRLFYDASPKRFELVGLTAFILLKLDFRSIVRGGLPLQGVWQPPLYQLIVSLCALYATWSLFHYATKSFDDEHADERPAKNSPLKSLLFPCRTAHTRLFPKKHSFSYSYLLVGVPVGWRSTVNGVVSVDLKQPPSSDQKHPKAWFSVDSADYLQRGHNPKGLKGKLEDYLQSQNEKPSDYLHVYFVTAPKFLGYSFNPVSFWYLYDEGNHLRAMILEVNNTFDERRIYFLKPDSANEEADQPQGLGDKTLDNLQPLLEPSPAKFSESWAKDFHVSPFNSRKGSYSLKAVDPFYPHLTGHLPINNIITLSSSKDHPKLVASIASTESSVDPSTFTRWDTLCFIASWWWVGFVTFPRIVREAGKLFFKHKLHVWYRPEVVRTSLGRKPTGYESDIALLFQDYLKDLIDKSSLSAPVRYIPAAPENAESSLFAPKSLSSEPHNNDPIVFQPTTPQFYTDLALAPHTEIFIGMSLREPDLTKAKMHSNCPELLCDLMCEEAKDGTKLAAGTIQRRGQTPWTLTLRPRIRWLWINIGRNFVMTSLDTFAMKHVDDEKSVRYRRATVKLMAAKSLTFGNAEILDLILWLLKAWLAWLSLTALVGLRPYGWGFSNIFGGHIWWLVRQLT